MTPRHAEIETRALGTVKLVVAGGAMTGLFFGHHHPKPEIPLGERVDAGDDGLLARAAAQLDEYLAGRRRSFDLPLRWTANVFYWRVWTLVQRIPYGTTTTYGAIARQLGREFGDQSPARRVGQAVGRNPLCVFVPCHRVVAASGSLTGYAGGIALKDRLLQLERGAGQEAGRMASTLEPQVGR